MAPTREQGIWMLERLVAGAVRYGHDLSVTHVAIAPEADDPTVAARLDAILRGADALVRWEPGVYVALLPDTGRGGAAVVGERLRAAAASEVAIGCDKRRLVVEPESAQALKVLAREGNTLSAVVRQAWDGEPLQTVVRNDPLRATGAHIGIVGHVTRDELLRYLTATELANGFANRFLLVGVERSKLLPFWGSTRRAAVRRAP